LRTSTHFELNNARKQARNSARNNLSEYNPQIASSDLLNNIKILMVLSSPNYKQEQKEIFSNN
jgi:hypothetical protein